MGQPAYIFGQDGEDDHLIGGKADDVLEGFTGNDILEGSDGNDTLNGGPDSDPMNVDIMTGGAGKDQSWSSTGSDVIKDFNPDEDNLWLPENTEGWFNARANTTVLTCLNGKVALEGVDLGPHVAAKEYPWLEWHEDMPLIA